MNRCFTGLGACCCGALLLACGSGSGAGGGDGGAGGAAGGGTGGAQAMYHGSVAGRVVDEMGQPIAGLGVSLCFAVCRVTDTDGGGAFLFEGIEPANQVLENIGLPGDDPAAAALVTSKFFDIVPVGVDEQVTIERPFVLPIVDTQGPLTGPQQFTLEGGLEVKFSADVFGTAKNPLPFPATALYFGAKLVAENNWPVHGYDGWTLLRGWALAVWDLEYENAFTVTAPLGLSQPLPAGSEVTFLVADYTYGFVNGTFLEAPAELTADGMAIVTPAGTGLDRSTLWFAAVRNGS